MFIAAAIVALVVSTRRPIEPAVILVLLIGALAIRYEIRGNVGSDVLDVTAAAINRVLAGLNPYGTGYEESRPPGSPFPYGPLAILWYAPVANLPRLAELLSASAVATLLAMQGRFLGLAIYAATPAIVNTSVDGSNDTTLGLLIALTFVIAAWRPTLAGAVLAGAVAFKLSAAAWVPAFLLWGGWKVAASFGLASLAFWSPVLFVWGPASFLNSAVLANTLPRDIVWSLGAVLRDRIGEAGVRVLDTMRLALGALTAILTLPFIRGPGPEDSLGRAAALDRVIVAGTLVYLVTLFAGSWATFAYFAALAPVLCLRVDDWLGIPTLPLVARSDPGESAEPEEDGKRADAADAGAAAR
jgi:hypothetical protein